MSKRVAIVQSNYIPWKGYFDLIASVDEFILYDDMQYTRRDWRNRNLIKTPEGTSWLTVPVKVKGKYLQPIRDTEIDGSEWQAKHWKSLHMQYARAPHFAEIAAWLEPLYLQQNYTHLSAMNETFLRAVCAYLGINTTITHSWDYPMGEGKSERLAALCAAAGGSTYLSGPSAKDYLDEGAFAAHGIAVEWFDYQGYPEYPQLWGAFDHAVTILDLLFNCGQHAGDYMKATHGKA